MKRTSSAEDDEDDDNDENKSIFNGFFMKFESEMVVSNDCVQCVI